ncbi:MAG: hypothetical protein J5771_00685 [Bacteroidales bacterium]|nr:hypothetical protein [Bacteroidales bacterium]
MGIRRSLLLVPVVSALALLSSACGKTRHQPDSQKGKQEQVQGQPEGPYCGPTQEIDEYSGAYYTGDYTSPFKTYLNKTDAEIATKLDAMWNHYFKGSNEQKVYFDSGNEAYILNVAENSVYSDGMAYGMMICVQTDHKEEFDKLWRWTKNHMWRRSGAWNGFFAGICSTNGSIADENPHPNAEMYFIASLLFAANYWNDGQYMDEAQVILKQMWENQQHNLFNSSSYVIAFLPISSEMNFTCPANSLPAFLELFVRWTETNQDKWESTVSAARTQLYKSSNASSGLFPECANFDGTPHSVSYISNSEKYYVEAMRCAMNFGADYYLFGVDAARQTEMAKRIIDFFEKDGYRHARFNWDGSNASESYTTGEIGCNAVACYALMGQNGYDEIIKKNLKMAWDEKFMTGQYRYYDGLVHYLAMLHLCGRFRIWKPQV